MAIPEPVRPRRRALRVIFGIALAIYIAGGLSRISFDVDVLKLLPPNLPQVRGLSLLLKNFAQPDELIITVEASTAERAEDVSRHLAAKLSTHRDLVKRVVAEAPTDFAELLAFQLLNLPRERFDALLTRLDKTHADSTLQDTLEELADSPSPQAIAARSYDPFGFLTFLPESLSELAGSGDEFSSADGKFRVLYVQSSVSLRNYREAIRWVEAVKAAARAACAGGDVALGFTGEPAFVADIAGSMDREMMATAGSTFLLVGAIFWLCYRRVRPLLMLLGMLALIFLLSMATAGWLLRDLTVISVGFASVMIGLTVDYGYFVFNQAARHTSTVPDLRRRCFRNVIWTCSTTAAVFFALNLSSLPGLSQLGSLVGFGVLIGAAVMLTAFAPLALRHVQRAPLPLPLPADRLLGSRTFLNAGALVTLAGAIILLGALFIKGLPSIDFSANTMRPRVSEAYKTMEKLGAHLSGAQGLLHVIVEGDSPAQIARRLAEIDRQLAEARECGAIRSYFTARPIWPDAELQRQNLAAAASAIQEAPQLERLLLDAGFTEAAFGLTDSVLRHWKEWIASSGIIWPHRPAAEWMLRRLIRHDGPMLASGFVVPVTGREEELLRSIGGDGAYLVSWEQLGRELKHVVPREMLTVMAALFTGVALILAIGLRSLRGILIFFVNTVLALACLAGVVTLLQGTVGLFSLAAVLLLLGTGTDYAILPLLELRRNGGHAAAAQQSLALVITLCAASSAIGFGALGFANNIGLAELGRTCALGLAINAALSLFLLPRMWELVKGRSQKAETPA